MNDKQSEVPLEICLGFQKVLSRKRSSHILEGQAVRSFCIKIEIKINKRGKQLDYLNYPT